MFERDLDELDTADLLAAASEFDLVEERAAVRKLEAALVFADRHAVVDAGTGGGVLPGTERLRVYGGEGCPGVAEFAPIEFGAVLRMSTGAAAAFIGEALSLRHRLPRIWAAVLAGNAMPWRARKVAQACLSLSMEAAAIVDRRVVGIVNTVTPGRLATIVKAAVWHVDPAPGSHRNTHDDPARDADAAADDPGPANDHEPADDRPAADDPYGPEDWPAPDDWPVPDHGPASDDWYGPDEHDTPTGPAHPGPTDRETAPAPGTDRATTRETDCQTGHGAVEDAFTRQMLAGSLPARLAAIKQHAYTHGLAAGTGRRANRHTLYVHLTDQTLATGTGVIRVEELGPLLLNQLTELLGHDQIVVKPVIDLHDQISVHSYEIPDRIRERVRLRHPVDMFPYSSAEATTRMDQDHITPYDRAGPPAQTNTDNLIPQGRLHHRAKTFGGWNNRRLPTGPIEWTSPHGYRFRVDHTGTHLLMKDSAV